MLSHQTQLCCFPIPFPFSSYFYHSPGALLPGELIFYSSMLRVIKAPPGTPCQQLSRMIQHQDHLTPPAELWDVPELSEAPAPTPSCAHSFPARLFSTFFPCCPLPLLVQFSQWFHLDVKCFISHPLPLPGSRDHHQR